MRSRAVRLILSVSALVAVGAAAYSVFTTEQKIADRRAALRAFDLHAREATFALADARAGQQAYVAAGQSSTYWVPKVTAIVQEVTRIVDDLRASAVSSAGRKSLMDASATITEFGNIDKRVRDYLGTEQSLMAGDVAFSEGGDAAGRAALQVETARIEEHQAVDADEAALRRLEAYALGGAVGWSALIVLILGLVPVSVPEQQALEQPGMLAHAVELPLRQEATNEIRLRDPEPAFSVTLKAAADVCTEFGRLRDSSDLKTLLGRAARLLDASGLVVWLGNADGADLHPVMAHGYSDQVLALMRAVPRHADNAAAAAYRSSTLQIVPARPGVALGAVVAPLLGADGCIGALTAEIRDGSEKSDDVQSLASIFAAQLAALLAPTASAEASATQSRTASA